jgi:hypothetical protein
MDKYITTPKVDTTRKIPYYETVIPTDIPVEDLPFYYIAQDGDRLDTISNLFYNTPTNWWVIAKANKLVNGSITVPMGTRLFIPNI